MEKSNPDKFRSLNCAKMFAQVRENSPTAACQSLKLVMLLGVIPQHCRHTPTHTFTLIPTHKHTHTHTNTPRLLLSALQLTASSGLVLRSS